ncbi:YqaA family protein [Halobaculum sp. MBLA0143]|uniref:YqaA family protein n=1 Tax=Halobaculum sp. MBLA0143 TaxID=3079933 RepID=UPI003525BFA4
MSVPLADSLSLLVSPALDGSTLAAETALGVSLTEFGWLERLVETATGPAGLAIVFVYSFLIAFALPGVSEVVLFAPLDLGLGNFGRLTVIVLVSAVGKAAGSVFAFHIGQEVKQAGPVIRFLRNSRFDVVSWSERRTVDIAQKYGYAGLAAALSVPFFPDTLSIYAFAVLEEDYWKFAAATFAGSVGRLVVTLLFFQAGSATLGV